LSGCRSTNVPTLGKKVWGGTCKIDFARYLTRKIGLEKVLVWPVGLMQLGQEFDRLAEWARVTVADFLFLT
jgi:hypothetical protein